MVKQLLKNKYFEDEIIRDYLLKIKHIVDKIHDDKRFKLQINRISESLTFFNELRNNLRLFNDKNQGLNSCRTFHSKQEINDVQQQLIRFKQSIQKHLLNEKLTYTKNRAIKIILKHLEKYQHQLFGRIFELEIDGHKKNGKHLILDKWFVFPTVCFPIPGFGLKFRAAYFVFHLYTS